jgi:hypothetical protein
MQLMNVDAAVWAKVNQSATPAFSAGTTFMELVGAPENYFFNSSAQSNSAFPSIYALNNGIVQSDYRTYYDACSPAFCSYTYTTKPSVISALTTALGVISGVLGICRTVVDQLINRMNLIRLPWHKRRPRCGRYRSSCYY